MGSHQLPRRQRHRPALNRLALGPSRPPHLFPAVDRCLHPRFGPVRNIHEPQPADLLSRDPGLCRRRPPAFQSGRVARCLPREKQGAAMTLFGLAALLAPVVGPTLGGWITDQYSWRWVFLINVPVGLLAFAACYLKLHDPDYLVAARLELRKRPFTFDSIGLSLLVIVMVCWEVM